MSLKNLEVHNLVAKNFVCAWRNTEGDPDAGQSNRHPCGSAAMELSRGIGKANVQTMVLTPDGKIISAMSGFVDARDLLWELEQALHTWHKLRRVESVEARKGLVRARIREMNEAEAKEMEIVNGVQRDPYAQAAFAAWTRQIVLKDRAFVSDNALMDVEDFRTRMLTGGHAGRFGYTVSKSHDRGRAAGTMTYAEFQKLPSTLRKRFMEYVPEAFHGDPTMVSLESLPKSLRKKLDKRLERMRKLAAKKRAADARRNKKK